MPATRRAITGRRRRVRIVGASTDENVPGEIRRACNLPKRARVVRPFLTYDDDLGGRLRIPLERFEVGRVGEGLLGRGTVVKAKLLLGTNTVDVVAGEGMQTQMDERRYGISRGEGSVRA